MANYIKTWTDSADFTVIGGTAGTVTPSVFGSEPAMVLPGDSALHQYQWSLDDGQWSDTVTGNLQWSIGSNAGPNFSFVFRGYSFNSDGSAGFKLLDPVGAVVASCPRAITGGRPYRLVFLGTATDIKAALLDIPSSTWMQGSDGTFVAGFRWAFTATLGTPVSGAKALSFYNSSSSPLSVGTITMGPAGTPSASPNPVTVAPSGTVAVTPSGFDGVNTTVSAGTGTYASGSYTAPASAGSDTLTFASLYEPAQTLAVPVTITSAPGPSSATFSGPSSGSAGSASTAFTVTLNVAAPSGGTAVTLSDGSAGGSFAGTGVSGSTLTIPQGSTAGTFTYSRPTAGTSTLTPAASGVAFTPTTLTYTAAAVAATAFTLTGPSSGVVGVASGDFTVTPNGTTTGTFTPAPVSGVTFTPATLSWSGDASAKTFTITSSAAGTVSVAGTFSNGLTPPASRSYTFNDVSSTVTITDVVNFGFGSRGLAGTVGVTWLNSDGTTAQARTTSGITETVPGASGSYLASYTSAVAGRDYVAVWDTGGSTPLYDSAVITAPGAGGGGGGTVGDSPGVTQLLARVPAPLTIISGRVSSSFDAIGNVSIGPGIYTMRSPSTASLVHFDAADDIANAGGGAGIRIEIVGGTGIGKRFVGITSVSGSAGAKDGVPDVDASGFDATTRYIWADPIPAPGGTDLTQVGLFRTGETGIQSMKKMMAEAVGSWDTTTNPGYATYKMDDVEVFRTALPTATGRPEAINAGGL